MAFHNNTLNPENCKQCAVGNIVNNKDFWMHLTDNHGATKLNYLGLLHQNLGRRFFGYTPIELLQIESAFLEGCGYSFTIQNRLHKPDHINHEVLFKGLCYVVSLLCRLDAVNDVLDYSFLFDFEKPLLDFQN